MVKLLMEEMRESRSAFADEMKQTRSELLDESKQNRAALLDEMKQNRIEVMEEIRENRNSNQKLQVEYYFINCHRMQLEMCSVFR